MKPHGKCGDICFMKVLITGNMGYLGSVLVEHIRSAYKDAVLIGYDTAYFGHILTDTQRIPEANLDVQYYGDLRRFPDSLLSGIDTVIHLAAISNDPMGKRFESVTEDINSIASAEFADKAKRMGVSRFIFASSCSIYGFTEGGYRKENDPLNPLTAYARSKVYMEEKLSNIADKNFLVTVLRFPTACGMSPRLRLDLVLNDFVASALVYRRIDILSDGTPWRPIIDVKDMALSILWAMEYTEDVGGSFFQVNVGRNECNYQVKEIAERVASIIPSKINISKDAQTDNRSYKVDFLLYEQIAPNYLPRVVIEQSIKELHDGLKHMNFNDYNFRESQCIRLWTIEDLINKKKLSHDFFWI